MNYRDRFQGGKRETSCHVSKRLPTHVTLGPPVPIVLQLNVEGFSPNKICMISQLVTRHKALVILLQETHCTNVEQLVLPNCTPAGSVFSRKHGLATFVHAKPTWTLVDQSADGSETEWLYVALMASRSSMCTNHQTRD